MELSRKGAAKMTTARKSDQKDKLTCYYIGPIQYAWRLGEAWRRYINRLFAAVDVDGYNPNSLEEIIVRKRNPNIKVEEIIAERSKWKETGQWKKFHEQMWTIRVLDIALGVLSSDFVVLYWPIGVEKGGTLDELYCAARCGIPILLVIRGRRKDMNDWVYDVMCELEKGDYPPSVKEIMGAGLTKFAKVFTSFKSLVKYVADNKEELLERKRFLREMGVLQFRPLLAPLFLRPGAIFDYVWTTREQYLLWLETNPSYKVDEEIEAILKEVPELIR